MHLYVCQHEAHGPLLVLDTDYDKPFCVLYLHA